MATLETQYKNFLKDNPNSNMPFEEWTKVNSRIIKQAIINMMKADEELGLYNEPKQETLEQIDQTNPVTRGSTALVSKQETLEEFIRKSYLSRLEDCLNVDFEDGVKLGAKWQKERMYSEEEVINKLTHFAVEIQRQNKQGIVPLRIKEWFDRNKKK